MAETYQDAQGRYLVKEPAGGLGGGVTSWAVRPATDAEIETFKAEEKAAAAPVEHELIMPPTITGGMGEAPTVEGAASVEIAPWPERVATTLGGGSATD